MAKKGGKAAKKTAKAAKKAKTHGKKGVGGIGGEGMGMMQPGRSRRIGRNKRHLQKHFQEQQLLEAEFHRKQEAEAKAAKPTKAHSKEEEKKKKKNKQEEEDDGRPPSGLPAEEKLEILVFMWKNFFMK